MSPANTHQAPATPHPLVSAWLVLGLFTLGWDASGLDLPVMRLIGTASGFPWQHDRLLEQVLHDGGRRLSMLLYAALLVWAVRPGPRTASATLSRQERLVVLVLVTLALVLVSLLKRTSQTSCPWEWSAFGGQAVYVSHWNLLVRDGGAGHCFPGGHVSSALAFFALCLPWLWSPSPGRQARIGVGWLAGILLAGLVAGAAQTLRGAHPPSHTLWTALICSGVALAGWWLAQPWLRGARTIP